MTDDEREPKMNESILKRLYAATAALVAAAVLAGCGGGGAGGQGGAPGDGGSGGASEAAALTLTSSVPSVGSDGKTVATITAFVKDGGNRAMANQAVDFSTADTGVILLPAARLTDASGSVAARMTVADPANRSVTVNVRSGTVTGTIAVGVVGTTISLDGPATLLAGTPAEFTVELRDSGGEPIAGKPVSVASTAGNTLSATALVTDATGKAKVFVTGTVPGADTITAGALGATARAQTAVSATQLVFANLTAGQELEVGGAHTVVVRFQGIPLAGQTVEFLTTRGTVSATATTDAAGLAAATLQSATAGAATITAKVGSVLASQRVEFVSRTPTKISVQASPANVGVNLGDATSNSSQLIAVVRDASDNPVKGQLVSFSADADPSNGRIEPAVATTDSAGVATVAFFPGANTTGNNQIVLRATVVGRGVTGTTTMTASRQELIVRVGTGNGLLVPDAVSYVSPWDAVVTDSSGNPVAEALVQASLVGVAFYKGQYYAEGAGATAFWSPGGEVAGTARHRCPGEDANGNLRLDTGEDVNGDGQVTPGNVAAAQVVAEGGRTDATGFARIHVKYPKEFANWVQVRLVVTITAIAGTEGSATRVFDLPVLVDDVKLDDIPPGGFTSAFGRIADCRTIN